MLMQYDLCLKWIIAQLSVPDATSGNFRTGATVRNCQLRSRERKSFFEIAGRFLSFFFPRTNFFTGRRSTIKVNAMARPVIGISKFPIKIGIVYRALYGTVTLLFEEQEHRQLLFEYKTTSNRAKYRRQSGENRVTNESPALPVNYHFPVDCIALRVQVVDKKKKGKGCQCFRYSFYYFLIT